MSAEKCCKLKAFVLLAMLTVAEGRRVSSRVRAANGLQSAGLAQNAEGLAYAQNDDGPLLTTPNQQEQLMAFLENMKVIMEDPGLLEQSEMVAEQVKTLAAEPKMQKWHKLIMESVEKLAERSHFEIAANQLSAIMEDTAKLLVEQLGLVTTDSNGEVQDFQQRAKVFSEQMRVIMDAPGIKERWTLLGEHLDYIMKDSEMQEQAKHASEELMAIMEDREFVERVKLIGEQVEAIIEQVEAINVHLTSQPADVGPTLYSFSLAESSSKTSFVPSALKRHGHQSLSGTASGIRSKMPSIVSALSRRANGVEVSAGEVSHRSGPRVSAPTMAADGNDVVSVSPEDSLSKAVIDLGILALRLGTCALMVHHGLDKIQNVDGFSANVVAKFFGFLPGPPQFWTYSAAATQIAGAGLLAAGLASRPVAASMTGTMIAAVTFHLLNTGTEEFPFGVPKAHSYNFELAAMYVLVLSYFTVAGAGKYSVDQQVFGGELNIYKGLVNKVLGRGDQ